MNFKKDGLRIGLLTLVAAIIWMKRFANLDQIGESDFKPPAHSQPKEHEKQENQAQGKTPETSEKTVRSTPFHSTAGQNTHLLGRTKPIGNTIEFRVVDGYAIGYGDILLGKPEEPIPGGRGTYEAPTPRYWEHGEIPYSISSDLAHPERVEKALTYLRQKTPVNFIPYSGQKDSIVFETGTEHCLSALGKIGGAQPIKLSSECQWQEVLHEILHSLGFIHEQSRGDRDEYVEILWNNIDEKFQDQFAFVPESFEEPIRSFPFDYHSVMLYRANAFVLHPEEVSIRSKHSEAVNPTKDGLSEGDIQRLNRMFRGYE